MTAPLRSTELAAVTWVPPRPLALFECDLVEDSPSSCRFPFGSTCGQGIVAASAVVWVGKKNFGESGLNKAAVILQKYLDDMSGFVMREQFEPYAAAIRLPLNILTSSANLTVSTLEDLQDGFDQFVEMIQSRNVSTMLRIVMDASFDGPDQIIGIYETNLMDGQKHVIPQFYSKMWLSWNNGVWQATKIHNTTQETRWPILMTRVPPTKWPPEELLK